MPDPQVSKKPKLDFPPNNVRSEEFELKVGYRDSSKCRQRRIIPAAHFDEPSRASGK